MENNNETPLFPANDEVPQNVDMKEKLEKARIELALLRENRREPAFNLYSTEN